MVIVGRWRLRQKLLLMLIMGGSYGGGKIIIEQKIFVQKKAYLRDKP